MSIFQSQNPEPFLFIVSYFAFLRALNEDALKRRYLRKISLKEISLRYKIFAKAKKTIARKQFYFAGAFFFSGHLLPLRQP